jgi:SAM-dependent methyltransferase
MIRSSVHAANTLARFGARRAINKLVQSPSRPLPSWNYMFQRHLLPLLAHEKKELESFDVSLWQTLNSERLVGQIVFEYGTLANWCRSWSGLKVLDIGSGRSTLPHWMASKGASVTCFEHPEAVEKRSVSGLVDRANQLILDRYLANIEISRGSMLELPFPEGSFDMVTSFSVIEHLDTDIATREYVPYPEQKVRSATVLKEMIRVLKPGGHIYLTSDCCDYTRERADKWRPHYYFKNGPDLSGAWPVQDVRSLFYDFVSANGCSLVGPVAFDPAILDGNPDPTTFRGDFFSGFCVLARKN